MLRRMLRKNLLGMLALGLLVLAMSTPALADGQRLTAHVSEPFVVNGHEYPAGRLLLRSVARYNPTATIDEIWAGRDCLGMLVAVRHRAAENSDRDSVLFERDASGRLVLVGYVLRSEGAAFRFEVSHTQDSVAGAPTPAEDPSLRAGL